MQVVCSLLSKLIFIPPPTCFLFSGDFIGIRYTYPLVTWPELRGNNFSRRCKPFILFQSPTVRLPVVIDVSSTVLPLVAALTRYVNFIVPPCLVLLIHIRHIRTMIISA